MAKGSIFTCLNLDRDQLIPDIQEFCSGKFSSGATVSELGPVNKGNNQYRCKIVGDNKEVLIDFYFRDDGTTTIQPKVGGHQELSIELATHILSKVPYRDVKNSSYSVKATDEIIQFVLEYLDDLDGVSQTYKDTTGQNGYMLYQYQSKIGDRLTIKYFTNKTLQIQGKPMYLYQEVVCLLAEFFPFDEVVKNQAESYSVPLEPAEVRREIESLLPTAHKVLDPMLINILIASVAFTKIDIKFPDYSSFTFSALRTLEGYLKYLFVTKGITVNKHFKEFKEDKTTGIYYLRPSIATAVGCPKTGQAMEEIYNYLNKNRHGLFHTAAVVSATRIISNKKDAHKIIWDTINLIESSHVKINTP